jgi:hypothetical protein
METTTEKPVKKAEVIYHNYLKPGKIIKVTPTIEKDFTNQTVEVLPENFIHPNAVRRLELRPDGNGSFTQIFDTVTKHLTKEGEMTELEWFSHMKGKDLDVHKTESNFWSGWMNRSNPTLNFKPYEVVLPREGKDIDLGTVEGMLEYKVLLSNTHKFIAPSWDERYNRPTYWFALIDEKITVDKKTEKMNLTVSANTEFMKIKDHRELLMEFLIVKDPSNPVGDNATTDWLRTQVYDIVENNPKLFIALAEDPDRDAKVMVFKGVRANAIKKSGDKYYTLGEEPIGKLGDVIGWLNDPTKVDFRKRVENQIDNHYKK